MRQLALFVAFAGFACTGGNDAVSAAEAEAIKAEVERTLRDAYDLSKPDAMNRMLAIYPASGRVVSANTGRAVTSRDSVAASIRDFWEHVGVNMREPKWEWTNLYVDVLSPRSAVVTGTYRIPHRNPNNQPHVLGGAMTLVFQKQGGRWVVIQEHLSDTPQTGDSTNTMATHDHH